MRILYHGDVCAHERAGAAATIGAGAATSGAATTCDGMAWLTVDEYEIPEMAGAAAITGAAIGALATSGAAGAAMIGAAATTAPLLINVLAGSFGSTPGSLDEIEARNPAASAI